MRRWIGCLLAALAVGLSLAESSSAQAASSGEDWTSYRMIAHAMGGIDHKRYTNSYDAFVENYLKGYRVFEVDLLLTADGKLAALHDWEGGTAMTIRAFKRTAVDDAYTPLSFRDIARLMHDYPDMYLVTDTKETDLALVRKQFENIRSAAAAVDPSILNRIIPEIYTPEMYDAVMDIYPFPNKLYSLYLSDDPDSEIVRFVREQGIRTVAMPLRRALFDPRLVGLLSGLGVKTYVHTVNYPIVLSWLVDLGIYGVYTDFLDYRPAYFRQALSAPARWLIWGLALLLAAGLIRTWRTRMPDGWPPGRTGRSGT